MFKLYNCHHDRNNTAKTNSIACAHAKIGHRKTIAIECIIISENIL
uniref:Uncharacterized protein n=1 Tax=Setaria italica TaxID=4555 RepID=K3ZFS6_SETIT